VIYVMSDIHGQKQRFDSVLRQIDLRPADTLWVLGDVIDRNPDGIRILRQLMAMPNAKLLLGNHEQMMLDSLYYPHDEETRARHLARWYRNGGGVTHAHLKRLRKALRAEIFDYLAALPLNAAVTAGARQFLLVHAAPLALYGQYAPEKYQDAKEFSLWYRFTGAESRPCPQTLVFGHSTSYHYQGGDPMRIWHGEGMLCIDCGSSFPLEGDAKGQHGRLACLRLDDMREFYSEM